MLIYPYKPGSNSAKALAIAMGIRRIKHVGSRFKGSPNKTVINWGSSEVTMEVQKCRVINPPERVAIAIHKLHAFECLVRAGVQTPRYTSYRAVAENWIREGSAVVCRTMLRANAGRGIVIADSLDELVQSPLYVKYTKKESEWRVHVVGGSVDIQRKVRDPNVPVEQLDWRIRNHAGGFIFQRNGLNPPVQVVEQATKAVRALGLDFGAVDVIYNKHKDTAYVLEVNCAPGLTGATLDFYKQTLGRYV